MGRMILLLLIAAFMVGVVVWLWKRGKKNEAHHAEENGIEKIFRPVSDGGWKHIKPEDIWFFKKALKNGFTEVAYLIAPGSWVKDASGIWRVVGMWAFFRPNGEIATFEWWEHLKNGHSRRLSPYDSYYTNQSFVERLERYGVRLSPRIVLSPQIQLLQGKTVADMSLHLLRRA